MQFILLTLWMIAVSAVVVFMLEWFWTKRSKTSLDEGTIDLIRLATTPTSEFEPVLVESQIDQERATGKHRAS